MHDGAYPDHVEPLGSARGLFYFVGLQIEIDVVDDAGKVIDSSEWDSYDQALEYARQFEEEYCAKKKSLREALGGFLAKNALLVVAFCHADSRWSILAGVKNAWYDTKLRFDTELEARASLKEAEA